MVEGNSLLCWFLFELAATEIRENFDSWMEAATSWWSNKIQMRKTSQAKPEWNSFFLRIKNTNPLRRFIESFFTAKSNKLFSETTVAQIEFGTFPIFTSLTSLSASIKFYYFDFELLIHSSFVSLSAHERLHRMPRAPGVMRVNLHLWNFALLRTILSNNDICLLSGEFVAWRKLQKGLDINLHLKHRNDLKTEIRTKLYAAI